MGKKIKSTLNLEITLLVFIILVSYASSAYSTSKLRSRQYGTGTIDFGNQQNMVPQYNGIAPPEKSPTNTFNTGKGFVGSNSTTPTENLPPKTVIPNTTPDKIVNQPVVMNTYDALNGFKFDYNSRILSDGFRTSSKGNHFEKYPFLLAFILILIIV